MTNQQILEQARGFVRSQMEGEGSGHDWWHIVRVVNNAKAIAEKEGGDLFIIELAALLHDIADHKFHDGDEEIGARKSQEWLESIGAEPETIEQVCYIVQNVSFKGGLNKHVMRTVEGKIVQDADRLDALGAIGVARAFAFGGAMGRELYNPEFKRQEIKTMADVQKNLKTGHTVSHFYEKLLTLKDKMNTMTAGQIAEGRHTYMEQYLEQFYAEWEGQA